MVQKLLSIDLETLDTSLKAVVTEIGIVVGDDQGNVIEKFRVYPDIQQQIDAGRTVSGSTILWWLKQSEEARANQYKARRISLESAREELLTFLSRHSDCALYLGNAPSFDCNILGDFLGSDEKPWGFWQERDVRTARMVVPEKDRAKSRVAHDALDDAEVQYLDFVSFLKVGGSNV